MSRSRRKIEIAAVAALVLALSTTGGVITAVAESAPAAPGNVVGPDNWIPAASPNSSAVAAPANWIPNAVPEAPPVMTADNWIP
ncbi:hypothetical protein ACFO3J_13300 [Streptomyces polygonati]|uniref:Secreted protein n=1 Tax=Streptomyces polygonati TaxID=1617087 RepID=A0ABV8HNP9_9ACTN